MQLKSFFDIVSVVTKNEFKEAVAIAKSNKDLTNVDISHLFGFGLRDFHPVTTTLDAVAKTIRWQAFRWDGSIDIEALNETLTLGRKKFNVIG